MININLVCLIYALIAVEKIFEEILHIHFMTDSGDLIKLHVIKI